ncbi:protein-L-isoaspartate O-methyltransferase family protein [Streptomyces sp. NPDC054933]
MTVQFEELRQPLADAMDARGDWPERSPWIRDAVAALPRHDFAPDRLWEWDGHAYVSVDRTAEEARWADLVYGGPDDAAVTQVTDGLATSSLSCQGVVVDMLDSLLLEPGHTVIELGAGTGWNAALCAWRAGSGRVTSVEVDAGLAAAAQARLDAVGAGVTVVLGDGAAGWPQAAPYDRLIATYAVDTVPWPWIEQTRAGARLVFPWGRLGHVALTVADDGQSATGWVQGLAQFMPARGTDTGRDWQQIRGTGTPEDERAIVRDLAPLRNDQHLRFALRVQLPDVQITTAVDKDGVNAWLHDGASSWATLSALGGGRTVAHEGGPRRLADELEAAWDGWLADGSTVLWDYGMTVERDWQYVWCRDPESGPRWPLQAAEPHLAS